jgi:O-antigen/teichoic acid export membrane protein
VVRGVDVTEFGVFSLGYVFYTLALGLSRAVIFEPLVIRYNRSSEQERLKVCEALGASVVIGVITGSILAIGALLIGGDSTTALLAMAVLLPGLLVQDGVRGYWYSGGAQRRAAVNDGVWGAVALPLLVVAGLVVEDAPASLMIMIWGLTGNLAGAWGVHSVRQRLDITGSRRWLTGHARLVGPLLVDYCVTIGVAQASFGLVAIVAGVTEFGIMRAALVPLGFLNVLYTGTRLLMLPMMSRRAGAVKEEAHPNRPSMWVSLVLSVAAALWSALIALAPGLAQLVVGDTWDTARPAFLPVAAVLVAQGLAVGADIALRGGRRPSDLVRARLVAAPVTLLLTALGATTNGALGAGVGMAIGYFFTTGMLWTRVIKAKKSEVPV